MGIRKIIDCDGCTRRNIDFGSYVSFHLGFIYGGPETELDIESLYLCPDCVDKLNPKVGNVINKINLQADYNISQRICKKNTFEETSIIYNSLVEGRRETILKADYPLAKKNYLIDIDGTITDDIPNEQPERMVDCLPFPDALETLNKWYDEGHKITFFTSRTEAMREVTETWLNKNGFKYHGLLMGKPRGGNYHWIDNLQVRATRYCGKFNNLTKASKVVEVFEE